MPNSSIGILGFRDLLKINDLDMLTYFSVSHGHYYKLLNGENYSYTYQIGVKNAFCDASEVFQKSLTLIEIFKYFLSHHY